MDQVYQHTVCIQPIIIASRNPPRLIEIEDPEDEDDNMQSET